MTRINEIREQIKTANDLNLSKTIVQHIVDMNKSGVNATDLMMKILCAVRSDAVETNTKCAR